MSTRETGMTMGIEDVDLGEGEERGGKIDFSLCKCL